MQLLRTSRRSKARFVTVLQTRLRPSTSPLPPFPSRERSLKRLRPGPLGLFYLFFFFMFSCFPSFWFMSFTLFSCHTEKQIAPTQGNEAG